MKTFFFLNFKSADSSFVLSRDSSASKCDDSSLPTEWESSDAEVTVSKCPAFFFLPSIFIFLNLKWELFKNI